MSKVVSTTKASGSGQNSKTAMHAQAIDYYASDTENEDDEGTFRSNSYDPQVAAKQAALLTLLEDCNHCNANKDLQDHVPCRINKNGIHKRISHDMVTAWVLTLVSSYRYFIIISNVIYL